MPEKKSSANNKITPSSSKDIFLYSRDSLFPVKDLPLYVQRTYEQSVTPEHTHDFLEIVFVAAGRGIHQLKKLDRKGNFVETFSYGIIQGDLFFLMPGDIHTYQNNENLSIYNILFTKELIASELAVLKELPGLNEFFASMSNHSHNSGRREKIHLPLGARETAETCLKKIIMELKYHKSAFRLSAKSLFLEFMIFIGRNTPSLWQSSSNETDASSRSSAVYKSINYMEAHIHSDISLKKLASAACLSPNYFCRQFKLVTGIRPWDYLMNLRIEKAKKVLLSSDVTIADAAQKSGFCDSSYFAKIFKSLEGITPREFRDKNRS